jgi:hypothetical protein
VPASSQGTYKVREAICTYSSLEIKNEHASNSHKQPQVIAIQKGKSRPGVLTYGSRCP